MTTGVTIIMIKTTMIVRMIVLYRIEITTNNNGNNDNYTDHNTYNDN